MYQLFDPVWYAAFLAFAGFLWTLRDRRTLLSPLNVALAFVAATLILGYPGIQVNLTFVSLDPADPEVRSSLERSFLTSLVGFTALAFGTLIGRDRPISKLSERFLSFTSTRGDEIPLAGRRMALIIVTTWVMIGYGIVAYTFAHVGIVPMFSDDPLRDKFFGSNAQAFERLKGVYTVAIHLLSLGATIGLFIWWRFKWSRSLRLFALAVAGLALIALLVTLKRGPLLFPIVYLATTAAFEGRIPPVRFLLLGAGVFCVGVAMWYIGNPSLSANSAVEALATNLFVEPRELALVWSSMDVEYPHPRMGATYVAGMLAFIPTRFFPFKDEHYLVRAVMRSLGFDPDISGAPRVGFVGEAWLNFGLMGVIVVGVIFGWTIARLHAVGREAATRHAGTLGSLLMTVVFFNWSLSFLTAGSSAFLFLLMYATILAPPILTLSATTWTRTNRASDA